MGGFDAISRTDFSAMVSKKLLAVDLTSSEKKYCISITPWLINGFSEVFNCSLVFGVPEKYSVY
jgi:hypothetical protein